MNIFICDDNTLICNEINTLISEFFISNNLTLPDCYTFTDGESLLSSDINPDIVFLDIEMPGLNGIEIGNILHNNNPNLIIIMVTSFLDYLDDAMRFNVFRYLFKPIDKNRFFRNLQDAITKYNKHHTTITIKCNSEFHSFNSDDIIMVEASLKKTLVYTKTSNYETNYTFSEIKQLLSNECFYQCHRSYIVNMNYIISFDSHYVHLSNNMYALMASRKLSNFKTHYLSYINSEI